MNTLTAGKNCWNFFVNIFPVILKKIKTYLLVPKLNVLNT